MGQIIPWKELSKAIAPHHPKPKRIDLGSVSLI